MVRCRLCNVKRWYDPNDLLKLFGDVEAAAIDGKMFCVKCGKKEYISAEFQHLSAKERMGVRVRRLAEIRTVRRIIWKDEC